MMRMYCFGKEGLAYTWDDAAYKTAYDTTSFKVAKDCHISWIKARIQTLKRELKETKKASSFADIRKF